MSDWRCANSPRYRSGKGRWPVESPERFDGVGALLFLLQGLSGLVWIIIICVVVFVAFMLAMANASKPAKAHDRDGRYAQSPHRDWFNALKNRDGHLCCSIADGFTIRDVDWDTKDGRYRVQIDGQWIDVPEEAVVTAPNKFGPGPRRMARGMS